MSLITMEGNDHSTRLLGVVTSFNNHEILFQKTKLTIVLIDARITLIQLTYGCTASNNARKDKGLALTELKKQATHL